jgi:histidinol phosphatase-like PHP family hydrolase
VASTDILADFHTHTILSDGALLPEELLRRALVLGYTAIALTDHVGWSNCAMVAAQVVRACEHFGRYADIVPIPGVEITHVPPAGIPEVAAIARRAGARLVVVHGETPVEPVAPGTNRAAVSCPDVDVLAHPGFLTPEEAALAAQHGVFVEISGRKGHSFTNGHVVRIGRAAGVQFLIDSDAHDPGDLLTLEMARKVGLGAGLDQGELTMVMAQNPLSLIERKRL